MHDSGIAFRVARGDDERTLWRSAGRL